MAAREANVDAGGFRESLIGEVRHPARRDLAGYLVSAIWSLAYALFLGLAVTLFEHLKGEPPNFWISRSTSAAGGALREVCNPPLAVFLCGLAAALPLPFFLYPWVRASAFRLARAATRRSWQHLRNSSDWTISRGPALAAATAPVLLCSIAGLIGVALRGSWAVGFLTVVWALALYDLVVAWHLLREPGCAVVELRREGVVLYGARWWQVRGGGAARWCSAFAAGAVTLVGSAFVAALLMNAYAAAVPGSPSGDQVLDLWAFSAGRRLRESGVEAGVWVHGTRFLVLLIAGSALYATLSVRRDWRVAFLEAPGNPEDGTANARRAWAAAISLSIRTSRPSG